MCLIAFAIQPRPGLALVLASNRDEAWSRPTAPLATWRLPSGKAVHAGRDLQAGGTWIGLAEDGRVALLTNVRQGLPEPAPRSRGELVTAWLDTDTDWQSWIGRFDPTQYGGFNLVLGDLRAGAWVWLSNRRLTGRVASPSDAILPAGWRGRPLTAGLYGLSNAALNTPWPKTLALKAALQRHLDAGADPDNTTQLVRSLCRMSAAADDELPDTGVPLALERQLSSPFVYAPELAYGTRSSQILHAWSNGRLRIQEWTHEAGRLGSHPLTHWPLAYSRTHRIELPDHSRQRS